MKKDKIVLLCICFLFLALTIGIFIGRNSGAGVNATMINEPTNTYVADPRLDINEMSVNQLKALPGIGELLAQRIVAYRDANGPFYTMEQVMNVEGIGNKKLEQISRLVKVGG